MTNPDYENYTDLMWLNDVVRDGELGPIEPLAFKPSRDRLFYFDHSSPEFIALPFVTRFGYDEESEYGASTVKVEFDGETLIYSLNSVRRTEIERLVRDNRLPPGYWRLFCSHLQLSIYTTQYTFPEGGMFLDFGDAPKFDKPVLAYCTSKPAHFCVVDPFFIISKAYFRLQSELEKNTLALADKRDKVFWRGSASGIRTTFANSQRYLLCSKMQQSKHHERLDFGIIDTPDPVLKQLMEELGEIPEFAQPATRVSPDTFSLYRYGVDVDGNSNSWGGFFTKMLSRAYLIRVASWDGFRQWYYPRLSSQDLYALVAPDLSDFDEVLDRVFSLSIQEITDKAQRLYEFASSMAVFDEIDRNNAELHQWLKDTARTEQGM
ncbi:hypothetical protein [Roseovarius sp. 2305UL8-3]|uniref:hypothetical protein n=1 Tax=Roseovarius conchicola TaxID=3121636 RepID=UPI0035293036